jgi:hypothetical protein
MRAICLSSQWSFRAAQIRSTEVGALQIRSAEIRALQVRMS